MAKFDANELKDLLIGDIDDTDAKDDALDADFKEAVQGDTPTPEVEEDDLEDESDEDGEDEDFEEDDHSEDEDLEEEDEDPHFDPDTSKKQAADKKNPANKAFAALNRDLKSLKSTNKNYESEIEYVNAGFAEIAEKAGYKGIKTAREFYDIMQEQNALAQYKKTNDPKYIADVAEKRIERKNNPSGIQKDAQALSKEKVALEMQKQMDELNTEYGTELTDVDQISKLPNARKIIDRMSKGDSLADAYLIVNKDIVLKGKTKAAKQKALNKAKGHNHVRRNAKPEGINNTKVSDKELNESMDLLSALFPGKTKSQYRKMIQEEKNMDS